MSWRNSSTIGLRPAPQSYRGLSYHLGRWSTTNHRAEFVAFCRQCRSVYGRDRCIVQFLNDRCWSGSKRASNPLTSKSVSFCSRADARFGILGERFFLQYRQRIHRIVVVLTERDLTGALVVDLTVD